MKHSSAMRLTLIGVAGQHGPACQATCLTQDQLLSLAKNPSGVPDHVIFHAASCAACREMVAAHRLKYQLLTSHAAKVGCAAKVSVLQVVNILVIAAATYAGFLLVPLLQHNPATTDTTSTLATHRDNRSTSSHVGQAEIEPSPNRNPADGATPSVVPGTPRNNGAGAMRNGTGASQQSSRSYSENVGS